MELAMIGLGRMAANVDFRDSMQLRSRSPRTACTSSTRGCPAACGGGRRVRNHAGRRQGRGQSRRPIRAGARPSPDVGWLHCGPAGSGHFVIMVHNGSEYGMMQGYAEGLSLTAAKTELGLDLAALTEMWHHGRVRHDSDLGAIEPHVADYGKAAGRCWKGWSWACLRR